MKTIIEVKLKNDVNKTEDVYSVIIQNSDIIDIVKSNGLQAGNAAIDKFVKQFTEQFKGKFSEYISKTL